MIQRRAEFSDQTSISETTACRASHPFSDVYRSAADLAAETIVPANRLAKELDKNPATVHRWAQVGVKCKNSDGTTRQVKLEAFHLGGAVYTSREAFSRFVLRSQPASGDDADASDNDGNDSFE